MCTCPVVYILFFSKFASIDTGLLLLNWTKEMITQKMEKCADIKHIRAQVGDEGLCPPARINRYIKTIADPSLSLSSVLFISCLSLSAHNARKQKR